MVQITIQIDGDKVAINQSAAPTKVETITKDISLLWLIMMKHLG